MSASRLWLARRMVTRLAAELPGREIHVTADSAYAGEELKELPDAVTWTTRLRVNAALHDLPPERTGKKGRPRVKGDRLPVPGEDSPPRQCSRRSRSPATARRRPSPRTLSPACGTPSPARGRSPSSSSGTNREPGTTWPWSPRRRTRTLPRVIERYAARWAIEVAIEDSKQLFGTGQARNRTAAAVERTLPFMLACQAVAVCWYATAGHHPADAEARRLDAPWYTTKTEPSTADMTAKLRRVIIAARFKRLGSRPARTSRNPRHQAGLGRRRRPRRLNHESREDTNAS